MTPETIALVRSSFDQVLPVADLAATLFYDRLFEQEPQLRGLFTNDLTLQKHALLRTLHLAVEHLDRPDELVPVLEQLGERHTRYGVQTQDYEAVRSALLWTLEQGLGPAFTPAVKSAWTTVYATLATTMQSRAEPLRLALEGQGA